MLQVALSGRPIHIMCTTHYRMKIPERTNSEWMSVCARALINQTIERKTETKRKINAQTNTNFISLFFCTHPMRAPLLIRMINVHLSNFSSHLFTSYVEMWFRASAMLIKNCAMFGALLCSSVSCPNNHHNSAYLTINY